ncbi:MAG: hypothetical protein L3J23_05445 [Flavobacteriaceae bacterium]|nr:hypothetical protein [Flavobacteriaceae bacterium]
MKKLALVVVFVFAVASLTSCRSKKNSCDYGANIQDTQQEVIVACVE